MVASGNQVKRPPRQPPGRAGPRKRPASNGLRNMHTFDGRGQELDVRSTLRGDLLGGATAAVVMLPVGLAYGVAAGVGPIGSVSSLLTSQVADSLTHSHHHPSRALIGAAAEQDTACVVVGLAGGVAETLHALDALREVPAGHVVDTVDEARLLAKRLLEG